MIQCAYRSRRRQSVHFGHTDVHKYSVIIARLAVGEHLDCFLAVPCVLRLYLLKLKKIGKYLGVLLNVLCHEHSASGEYILFRADDLRLLVWERYALLQKYLVYLMYQHVGEDGLGKYGVNAVHSSLLLDDIPAVAGQHYDNRIPVVELVYKTG